MFSHWNLDRTFDNIPTNKKACVQYVKGASPTAAKLHLQVRKSGGQKKAFKKKMILQNAFIRIQFLEKFQVFLPLLKMNVAL